ALYEPIHGSAPDIAGKGVANPIATLLSFAMALRYSFDLPGEAELMEKAVSKVLEKGLRTGDIMQPGKTKVGTKEMGEAVLKALEGAYHGGWPRRTAFCGGPMSTEDRSAKRSGLFLAPGEGRSYPMGRISAVFKADGGETEARYSVSEWWLEPHTQGPGAHSHPEDDVFYVIEGTMSFLIGDRWIEAAKGSFVLAPAGVVHDFENRHASRAGVLNFSIPGDFEKNMPAIAQWFAEHPPKDA
ncbi:MAG: isocitrate/isopropylmalate family dehydrogenase, partial [Alphaproteobacteria bacterium]